MRHPLRLSPTDKRTYQNITLENGLRALLISDPLAPKSAAALAVNVGHFDDPNDREGLAHFLEHMLFLGTDQFPHAGEYQQFINHHGGSNNAWTGTEFTNFFFDIDSPWLEQALSRFSRFFIAPLFTPELVDKERQAVNSEYHLKIEDDVRRLYQVHKETVNPAHPFSQFSVGSTQTLADEDGRSIRDDLLDFYQHQYSADKMSLVIISSTPIEQLGQWTDYFVDIPRVAWEPKQLPSLLRAEDQAQSIYIKPLKDVKRLTMSFNFEGDFTELYKNKPLEYLAHLIGFEGTHSLISLLRQQGHIQTMTAGGGISGQNFREFTISFQLTEQGIHFIDHIVETTFSYIRLIEQRGIEQWRYKEKQRVFERAFHYQERIKPIDLASHYALNMQLFVPDDVIIGDYLMEQFDPVEIDSYCKQLIPENMRLGIIHPGVKTTQKALWYHTPYSQTPFSTEQLKRWKYPRALDISLPEPNPFLKITDTVNDYCDVTDVPQCIVDQKGFKIWHMQEGEFRIPKGHIYLSFDSAFAVESVKNIACCRLLVELMLDHLAETTYQAEIAGMSYHLYAHQGGFTFHTSGFSDRQFDLLKLVLDGRLYGAYAPERFKIIKQQLIENWQNQAKIKPINQLFQHLTALLQPNNPTGAQLVEAVEYIELADLSVFVKHLYQDVFIEAFIYGSWSREQASSISDYLYDALARNSNAGEETPRELINITGQQSMLYPLHCRHSDSAFLMYFQSEEITAEQIALVTLCNHLMSSTFFYELRTVQQLGYIVGNGNLPLNRHPGILFYIQSPHANGEQMRDAIDEFIDHFPVVISQLKEEQWQEAKQGLAGLILEKESNMRTRARRLWVSIGNKDTTFDQREQVAAALSALNREQVIAYASRLKSPKRDRLILYADHHNQVSERLTSGTQVIRSIDCFHQLCPKFVH